MKMLKIGDRAPENLGTDQSGKQHKLSDYKGKKLVVFFYPRASTPGCTAEACDLRDNYHRFLASGYEVLGISADSAKKQTTFKEKNQLPYSLIADTEREVIEAFGVWGEKKFMGRTFDGIHRTTFIINEEGFIEEVITKVKTKEHAKQLLK
ncbi:MAG: thioredoxin-dependent thiol peroxidase [Flavobacteriaceae bacterium]